MVIQFRVSEESIVILSPRDNSSVKAYQNLKATVNLSAMQVQPTA